jgi:ABC-2 type transport system ATP-binding protein
VTGSNPPAIECRGLAKSYGGVRALVGLDLAVPAGSLFGLLGPNGAGKTTLLRLITGLRSASAGTAFIEGRPIGRDTARRIGYLDQDPRFYPWMTGLELLRLSGSLCGLTGGRLAAGIDRAIDIAGLAGFVRRKIAGYSGGMRQRLGIAQAIVHEPPVLLLDEPVSSLDPEGRHDVLEVLTRLRGRSTVVMSTHILEDAERVCDRVAILDHGRLIVESQMDTLLARYATPVYDIDLATADEAVAERVVALLRGRPWVTGVAQAGARLHVDTNGRADVSVELLAALADTRVAVERVERSRPSLEDVFLRVLEHPRTEHRS